MANTIPFRTFLLAQMIGSGKTTFVAHLGDLLRNKVDVTGILNCTMETQKAADLQDVAQVERSGNTFRIFNQDITTLDKMWWEHYAVPKIRNIVGCVVDDSTLKQLLQAITSYVVIYIDLRDVEDLRVQIGDDIAWIKTVILFAMLHYCEAPPSVWDKFENMPLSEIKTVDIGQTFSTYGLV